MLDGRRVRGRGIRRSVLLVLVVGLLAGGGLVASPTATAAPQWAPAGSAPVHPGVQLTSPRGQCTANFVFTQGADVFLGMAAHCVGLGASDEVNGCEVDSLPLGTPVRISGATKPGSLAYSSWLTMRQVGEDDLFACMFNDFALVRVDPADHGRINPSIPHWGGPTGVRPVPEPAPSPIYSFGNSRLRDGIPLLQPKFGFSLGSAYGGWTHETYQLLPGIPGDSGGPTLDANGLAMGVLSTLVLLPLPGSNNMADVGHVMAYARTHALPGLELVPGTEPFAPRQLPAILALR